MRKKPLLKGTDVPALVKNKKGQKRDECAQHDHGHGYYLGLFVMKGEEGQEKAFVRCGESDSAGQAKEQMAAICQTFTPFTVSAWTGEVTFLGAVHAEAMTALEEKMTEWYALLWELKGHGKEHHGT